MNILGYRSGTNGLITETIDTVNITASELKVDDNSITLNYGNNADTLHSGFLTEYDSSGKKWSGLMRKGAGDWYLVKDATTEPTGTVDPSTLTAGTLNCTISSSSTLPTTLTANNIISQSGVDLVLSNNGGTNQITIDASASGATLTAGKTLYTDNIDTSSVGALTIGTTGATSIDLKQDLILSKGVDYGTTIRISNGAETGSGFVGNTQAVINRALTALGTDGTIILSGGSYDITGAITIGAYNVRFVGDGETIITQNTGGQFNQANGNRVAFDNIRFTLNVATATEFIYFDNASSSLYMNNCYITFGPLKTQGSFFRTNITNTGEYSSITNSTFDMSTNTTNSSGNNAIMFLGVNGRIDRFRFQNDIFIGNTTYTHWAISGGGKSDDTPNLQVSDCRFDGCWAEWSNNGSLQIDDSIFVSGGITCNYVANNSNYSIVCNDCEFYNSGLNAPCINVLATGAASVSQIRIRTNGCHWEPHASNWAFYITQPGTANDRTVYILSYGNTGTPSYSQSSATNIVQDSGNVIEYPYNQGDQYTSFTANIALGATLFDTSYGLMRNISTNYATANWEQIMDSINGDLTVEAALSTNTGLITNTLDSNSTGTGALVVQGGLGVAKNVYVGGNLVVQGTTTSIETTNVVIDDALIKIADNNTGDAIHSGLYGQYNDGSFKYWGLMRKHTTNDMHLIEGTTTEPTTSTDPSTLSLGLLYVRCPMAEIYFYDNTSTTTTLTTQNTWYKVAGTTSSGHLAAFTHPSSNRITCATTREVMCHAGCTFSYSTDTNNSVIEHGIVWSQDSTTTPNNNSLVEIDTKTANQLNSTAIHSMNEMNNGDYIELWVRCTSAAGVVYKCKHMNLFIMAMGN